MRLKFKKHSTPRPDKKHINFHIGQLRENTENLRIDQQDEKNDPEQQRIKNLTKRETSQELKTMN